MLNSCVMHRHTGPAPGIMVWGGIGYHSHTPLVRIVMYLPLEVHPSKYQRELEVQVGLFAFLLHISFLGFGWKRVAINSGPKNPKDLLKKRRVRRHSIAGTLNSQRYISEVLEPVVLPYLQGLPTTIFQQDNA
ncbi:transposable element Tcb1 transposase [Trichonephila clavipes]|nr:transposable element Tcb1 transposase [Trichonephila clavipes]